MTAEVTALHDALCDAMVAADITGLDSILAEGFTLTHTTGHVQSKSEWLDAIDTGQMKYHQIDTVETTIGSDGAMPVLTARTLTDAIIWGTRAAWRLTLRSVFEPHGDGWVISRTLASTW